MSIMVTGGTGFIGNRIVRKLVERGEEVVCFDLANETRTTMSLQRRESPIGEGPELWEFM